MELFIHEFELKKKELQDFMQQIQSSKSSDSMQNKFNKKKKFKTKEEKINTLDLLSSMPEIQDKYQILLQLLQLEKKNLSTKLNNILLHTQKSLNISHTLILEFLDKVMCVNLC